MNKRKTRLNYIGEEVAIALPSVEEIEKILYYRLHPICPDCGGRFLQLTHEGNNGIGYATVVKCPHCMWEDDITDYGCW